MVMDLTAQMVRLSGYQWRRSNNHQANILSIGAGHRGKDLIDRIKENGFNRYKQRLSEILGNPACKGKIEVKKWFGDEEIDGLRKPIIKEELFNRARSRWSVYDNFQKPKSRINNELITIWKEKNRLELFIDFCGGFEVNKKILL